MGEEARLQGSVVTITMHVPNNQMEVSVFQESWSQLRRQERVRSAPINQMEVGVCCGVDMVEEARQQESAVTMHDACTQESNGSLCLMSNCDILADISDCQRALKSKHAKRDKFRCNG